MPGLFHHQGVRFKYPENWQVEREETDNGWTVTVQSPNTAFFLLTFDADMPTPDQVLETSLDALQSDYQDLEFSERVETLTGQPAIGHDFQFTSLDLTNTGWTRAFCTSTATIFVMCQLTDLDLDVSEPVLHAICASLEVEDE